ncbi:MAG: helix-turn-helix domain-containing protein [Chloroflexi bacterium]|nr:helix-turn-helix domain-containing protein [Chloroflexota bacterium]
MGRYREPTLITSVRAWRLRRGLSQETLARALGLSRQAIHAIESGQHIPSTAIALRLARALDCRVEDLFSLPETTDTREAELPSAWPVRPTARVRLAQVHGRLIAQPLTGAEGFTTPADGIITQQIDAQHVRVILHTSPEQVSQTLLLAGCAPALGLLTAHAGQWGRDLRAHWIPTGSLTALRALARGDVHLAGTHLRDPQSGDTLPAIQQELAGRSVVVVTLARWFDGLLLPPGNPLRIRQPADLLRPGVTIVNREDGAGSRLAFDTWLAEHGLAGEQVRGYRHILTSHEAVAAAVAHGLAAAGPGIQPAAEAFGLDFLPLSEERFDLVIPAELFDSPRVQRLLDLATSWRFRRELEAARGYDLEPLGTVVARLHAGAA